MVASLGLLPYLSSSVIPPVTLGSLDPFSDSGDQTAKTSFLEVWICLALQNAQGLLRIPSSFVPVKPLKAECAALPCAPPSQALSEPCLYSVTKDADKYFSLLLSCVYWFLGGWCIVHLKKVMLRQYLTDHVTPVLIYSRSDVDQSSAQISLFWSISRTINQSINPQRLWNIKIQNAKKWTIILAVPLIVI